MRPNEWDGSPNAVLEVNVHVEHVSLDHLTAGDNESQRVVYANVYLDPDLVADTTVRWTGKARTTNRPFRFARPSPLKFERTEEKVQ